MAEITITMRLYGALRKYGETVVFSAPSGCTAMTVKERLAEVLKLAELSIICDSVLAQDNVIINNDAVLTHDCHLTLLPPVCGG